MKLQEIAEKLSRQNLLLFSSTEFRRAAELTPASAKQLLIRYARKGYVLKVRENRGLYCLRNRRPHPWLVANRLLRPSYISLETALAHYGQIPEIVQTVTSVTAKTSKQYESLDLYFTYQKVKETAFTGYQPLILENQTVFIAELEKALADYLYFVHLGRKELNDRLRWRNMNRRKVLNYLRLFERDRLVVWANHVIPR